MRLGRLFCAAASSALNYVLGGPLEPIKPHHPPPRTPGVENFGRSPVRIIIITGHGPERWRRGR